MENGKLLQQVCHNTEHSPHCTGAYLTQSKMLSGLFSPTVIELLQHVALETK